MRLRRRSPSSTISLRILLICRRYAISHVILNSHPKGHHPSFPTFFLNIRNFLKEVTAKEPLDPIGRLSADLNHPVPDDRINIIIVRQPTRGDLQGRIFEKQTLKYLDSLEEPGTFSIRSLEDSKPAKWVYPGPTKCQGFLPTTFAHTLL